MGEVSTYVLNGFSLRPRKIVKDKSNFILLCENGRYLLSRTFDIEALSAAHSIKELLFERGFAATDRFFPSRENDFCLCYNDGYYALSDSPPYKEPDFGDPEVFAKIIRLVAEMHLRLRETDVTPTRQAMTLESEHKLYSDSINRVKRMVGGKQLTDFDVLLLRNMDYYSGLCKNWYQLSASPACLKALDEAASMGTICHMRLKEETVQLTRDGARIVDFTEAAAAHHSHDLSMIIKRHFQSAENAMPIREITALYSRINPLSREDLLLLLGRLIFPDKFMKIVMGYGNKKRNWVPGSYIERLDSVISAKHRMAEYLAPFAAGFGV